LLSDARPSCHFSPPCGGAGWPYSTTLPATSMAAPSSSSLELLPSIGEQTAQQGLGCDLDVDATLLMPFITTGELPSPKASPFPSFHHRLCLRPAFAPSSSTVTGKRRPCRAPAKPCRNPVIVIYSSRSTFSTYSMPFSMSVKPLISFFRLLP
jgi:hypothetical protein